MNQGTQGYSLKKKTEGRKSRDTVSLTQQFVWKETKAEKSSVILPYTFFPFIQVLYFT
jgi:hypothetical protein